jgi:hypothetical protein
MTVVRALLVVSMSAGMALARCGDDPGDASAVADARAQVEADCPCAAAETHRAYARCAGVVLAASVEQGLLPRQCKSTAKRCASRSVCGRPGYVTCCRDRNGVSKCNAMRDVGRCTARGGTPKTCPSCCDACTMECVTTTSTSTTTTTIIPCGETTGAPYCYGDCPPAAPVCAYLGPSGGCQCVAGSTPCNDTTAPACDGTCPAGEMCVFGGFDCGCVPVGTTPCTQSGGTSCGGPCPTGGHCVFLPAAQGCVCPAADGCGAYPACSVACPPTKVCKTYDLGFAQACLCTVP